ncbi:MAG: hypothetical protein V3V09_03840 [Arenicellales bacterium]
MRLSRKQFLDSPNKVVTLLGMSGVGKTTLASRLPQDQWFHYSGDYRIGTQYLQEPILDNIKQHAMESPFLRDLIRSDSIYICNNITVENLQPISTFLGKIGNPELGGMPLAEFKRRQRLFRHAEINAMNDVPDFMQKGRDLYTYPNFLVDAGGSVCELSDADIWSQLAEKSIIIYLKADAKMEQLMIERAQAAPKPMYYDEAFLDQHVAEFLTLKGLNNTDEMVPDEFVQWVFPKLIAHRRPLYERVAEQHGYTVDARQVMAVENEADVIELIAGALN